MSKKKRKRGCGNRATKDNWGLPKNAADYFDPHYDDKFKREHPVLYVLTVIAIVILVVIAPIIYLILTNAVQPSAGNRVALKNWFEFAVFIAGFVASFGISIGLCNLFLMLHKQYLGHYVTIYSIGIGIFGAFASLILLWLI